jgi:hypothetical protein
MPQQRDSHGHGSGCDVLVGVLFQLPVPWLASLFNSNRRSSGLRLQQQSSGHQVPTTSRAGLLVPLHVQHTNVFGLRMSADSA